MRILIFFMISLCLLWDTGFATTVTEQNGLIALQNILEYNNKSDSRKMLFDWRMTDNGIAGTGIAANDAGELVSLNISDRGLTGTLTLNHLARLTEVEAAYNNFSAITCTGLPILQNLNLKANKISNLLPVSGLKSLTALNLGHNHDIVDISPLAGLENLVKLDLSLNRIRDLEALSSLVLLQELNLRANRLRDLSGIAFLENLESLDFSFNEISDISILGKFPKLKHLAMRYNPITSLDPLRLLPELRSLECNAIRNNEIHVLHALKKLEKLHMEDNNLHDISALAALTNLRELNLANNQIQDIYPLRHATELEYLNIARNPLTDISALVLLGKLKNLFMQDTGITDLHDLESLTRLEHLHLSGNSLRSIASLSALTRLKRLDLSNNALLDLAPLSQLVLLESLELSNNRLQDIEHLKNHGKLARLMLDNNRIRNIEALLENFGSANRSGKPGILRVNNNRLPLNQMHKLGEIAWEGDQNHVYFFLRLQYLPTCSFFDIPAEDLEIDGIKSDITLEHDFRSGMEIQEPGRVVFGGPPGFGKIVLANKKVADPEKGAETRSRSGVIHGIDHLPDVKKIKGLTKEEKENLTRICEILKTRGFMEIIDEDRNEELDMITRFLIKN